MNNIRIQAKLRAYSKSPFYKDYVRGVNVEEDGSLQELEAGVTYARRDGKWVPIFIGDMTDISDRLVNIEDEAENQRETFTTYFHNINVDFDKNTSELVYKDYLGNVYRMHIESLVDNDSIRYNEENALELKYKPDNETIEREAVKTDDASWKGIIKVTGIKYKETVKDEVTGEITEKERILTGKQLAENQVAVDTRFKVIEKSLDDIASYVKGDSYQG